MRRMRPTERSTTRSTLLAVIGALLLLIASCGDGDDDTATDSTTTTASGSTATTGTDGTAATSSSATSGSGTTSDDGVSPQNVLVFFGTGDPDVCDAVAPRQRAVRPGDDPIRVAFDELVAGPTASETSSGAFSFFSAETAGAVRSARLQDGRLVVDFDDFRAVLTPAGANTSCGSAGLLAELSSTAFQFTDVDAVRYELEGSCDAFGEWLQRECIEIDRTEWAAAAGSQLPGEPFEGILPTGAVLGVINVAADDQLNVRERPGADQPILDALAPLTTGLIFTGRERLLGPPTAVWYEIEVGNVVGWVHSRYAAPQAGTFDITSEVVTAVGSIPTGATIDEVGATVLEARSRFADPRPTSIVVDGPSVGDLSEITYDLTGFGDDSVLGERLHLFIAETGNDDAPLELRSVEVTYLCARGSGTGEICP